ncbi:MAG TPA: hypothetical protein VE954_43345 [Oligoflexus sp.]|uniref:hypothetical protein n=1 Tax=Oligoflexus sp. TaxID=1971216 RepID=UPI002D409A7F|nr:hypothetical protein [Oligoflexus sp.]HYX39981.1 hypothetical protein [Oligoflexus sp.]
MEIAKQPRDDAPFEIRKAYHELPNIRKWGPGPWADEPNKELWKSHGFDCLINRNHMGAWCGYVGVPKGHPYYGKSYRELEDADIYPDCHGGITYSEFCQGEICHPTDEHAEPVYWFGFDCAHAWDLVPSMEAFRKYDPTWPKFPGRSEDKYRDISFVKAEVERLAKQLAEI